MDLAALDEVGVVWSFEPPEDDDGVLSCSEEPFFEPDLVTVTGLAVTWRARTGLLLTSGAPPALES